MLPRMKALFGLGYRNMWFQVNAIRSGMQAVCRADGGQAMLAIIRCRIFCFQFATQNIQIKI
jgi:hypothetical protein